MDCYLCRDRGIVIWTEKRKEHPYEFMGRCGCRAGKRFPGVPPAEAALSPFEIEAIEAANREMEQEQPAKQLCLGD